MNIAKDYLWKTVERGNVQAIPNLLEVCIKIGNYKEDVQKILKLYDKLILEENSLAITDLACIYDQGKGVEVDHLKSIQLLEKAAKLENSIAIYQLGTLIFYFIFYYFFYFLFFYFLIF